MAKELPYFKFFVSEWSDGDITLEDMEAQGLFINICAYYWSNNCDVTISKLNKKFRHYTDIIDHLISEKLIKIENNNVIINFLIEQLSERDNLSSKNSLNAKKRWDKMRKESERNATALNSQCETDTESMQYREEKKREEKKREEKRREKKNIPSFDDFFIHAKSKIANVDKKDVKLKYDSWIENDWKDGNDKKITNWKSKLTNTVGFLKKTEEKKPYEYKRIPI